MTAPKLPAHRHVSPDGEGCSFAAFECTGCKASVCHDCATQLGGDRLQCDECRWPRKD